MTEKQLKRLEQILNKTGDDLVEEISYCIEMRSTLLNTSRENYEIGDFVIDNKNQELGFIIGLFNGYLNTKDKKVGDLSKVPYLIVTRNTEKDSTSRFRVRYTKRDQLEPIRVDQEPKCMKRDLRSFCEEQCIMKCSELCNLYKYKE